MKTLSAILAGILLELPVYRYGAESAFTILGGYAIQASGDGSPENEYIANNNIAVTHLTALSWYGAKNSARIGYIYGSFTLDDDGYRKSGGSYIPYNGPGAYFNYPVRELESSK